MNNTFVVSKKIISRKNQDGTVIIMLLDDSNSFFKLDDLTATIWGFFQRPVCLDTLFAALQESTLGFSAEQTSQAKQIIETFKTKQLLDVVMTTEEMYDKSEMIQALNLVTNKTLKAIGEYDLAKLEEEVLNESVYLDVFAGSDLNLKQNVSKVENSLDKILKLDAIHFNWTDSENKDKQVGLVAQQVKQFFPDLVTTDDRGENLAVAYLKMVPYLVHSLQEMHQKIEQQNKTIQQLSSQLNKIAQH